MDGDLIRAAVLVPVSIEGAGDPLITLIQRTAGTHAHQGQVAFPGGRCDARDGSLLETALREAEEEIGLARAEVQVIGALAEHRTMSSNFLVSPFVGRIPPRYRFRADPREVESIFTVPLRLFAPATERPPYRWRHGALAVTVPSVQIGARVVWGLTLRIIDELLVALPELLGAR